MRGLCKHVQRLLKRSPARLQIGLRLRVLNITFRVQLVAASAHERR